MPGTNFMERRFYYNVGQITSSSSGEQYGIFQPTIQGLLSAYGTEMNAFFAIFNKLRIKSWRVELQPTYQVIADTPSTSGSSNNNVFGSFWSCYPRQWSVSTYYDTQAGMLNAPRLKRTAVNKWHIRSLRAETIITNLFQAPNSSATTAYSANPVRYPWVDISYVDGIYTDTFPPVCPVYWLCDPGLNMLTSEQQTWNIFYTIVVQFKDKR